jgi:hypothetical protein
MTDVVLGVVCAVLGSLVGLVGAGLLAFGCWALAFSSGGGWWIAAVFYLLIGAGVGFVGLYCARYGMRLLQGAKATKDRVVS